jgi:hypothetical protein
MRGPPHRLSSGRLSKEMDDRGAARHIALTIAFTTDGSRPMDKSPFYTFHALSPLKLPTQWKTGVRPFAAETSDAAACVLGWGHIHDHRRLSGCVVGAG